MTQAPTPGPLSGDFNVEEYVADYEFRADEGSYSPTENERVLLIDAIHGALSEASLGLAPTAPVEASGSELHPATADLVDRFAAELKSKLAKAEAKYGYAADWLNTDWQDELNESLAEHIQKGDPRDVAAYCAFAWHHGWSTSDALGHFAPKLHFQSSRERIAKCIRRAVGDAWIGECQAEVAADAVLNLRPQPSGETREAVAALMRKPLAAVTSLDGTVKMPLVCLSVEERDAILDLIRPAPVASGGQHSSGEVKGAWVFNAPYLQQGLAAISVAPTPVAETAGEAVAWRWRIGDDTPWVISDRKPPDRASLQVQPLFASQDDGASQ